MAPTLIDYEEDTLDAEILRAADDPKPGPAILVVDDDAGIRRFIRTLLTRATPVRVLEAAGPRVALELACTNLWPLDLLICDIDLGAQMNGIELAGEIARMTPTARIVLMSGDTERAHELRPEWTFLEKPFSVATLLDAIEDAFGIRTAMLRMTA